MSLTPTPEEVGFRSLRVRAVESVLSPLGWGRTEIRRELTRTRAPELTAFADASQNEPTQSRGEGMLVILPAILS